MNRILLLLAASLLEILRKYKKVIKLQELIKLFTFCSILLAIVRYG